MSEDDAGTGADLESVAFSPSGGLLATANNSGTLSVFQVAANGVLTTVSEDYASTGLEPHSVVFSPSGGLLATANSYVNTVSILTVAP